MAKKETPKKTRAKTTTAKAKVVSKTKELPVDKEIKPRRRLKAALIVLVCLVVAGVIGLLVYGYIDAKNDIKKLSNPAEASKFEKEDLIAKVGKLADLPKNESPTIATVNDLGKLKGQQFFNNAQKGDKVLIYTKSKRAVLYRPSTGKIIESSPVNLGEQASPSPEVQPAESPAADTPAE